MPQLFVSVMVLRLYFHMHTLGLTAKIPRALQTSNLFLFLIRSVAQRKFAYIIRADIAHRSTVSHFSHFLFSN